MRTAYILALGLLFLGCTNLSSYNAISLSTTFDVVSPTKSTDHSVHTNLSTSPYDELGFSRASDAAETRAQEIAHAVHTTQMERLLAVGYLTTPEHEAHIVGRRRWESNVVPGFIPAIEQAVQPLPADMEERAVAAEIRLAEFKTNLTLETTLSSPIMFARNSTALDSAGANRLRQNAKVVRRSSERVLITAFADVDEGDGAATTLNRLARVRAETVKQEMTRLGVASDALTINPVGATVSPAPKVVFDGIGLHVEIRDVLGPVLRVTIQQLANELRRGADAHRWVVRQPSMSVLDPFVFHINDVAEPQTDEPRVRRTSYTIIGRPSESDPACMVTSILYRVQSIAPVLEVDWRHNRSTDANHVPERLFKVQDILNGLRRC